MFKPMNDPLIFGYNTRIASIEKKKPKTNKLIIIFFYKVMLNIRKKK